MSNYQQASLFAHDPSEKNPSISDLTSLTERRPLKPIEQIYLKTHIKLTTQKTKAQHHHRTHHRTLHSNYNNTSLIPIWIPLKITKFTSFIEEAPTNIEKCNWNWTSPLHQDMTLQRKWYTQSHMKTTYNSITCLQLLQIRCYVCICTTLWHHYNTLTTGI